MLTRDELKAKLAPIVTDITLTKEERDAKLLPIIRELMEEGDGVTPHADLWNGVMVEIIEENGLARH